MQDAIEVHGAEVALVHGREHLDIERREPVPARQAGDHQIADGLRCLRRIVLFKEEEVARVGGPVARLGHLASVNAVGIGDDEALRGLAKDFVEANHGNGARGDGIAENHAGAHGRELVLIADEK